MWCLPSDQLISTIDVRSLTHTTPPPPLHLSYHFSLQEIAFCVKTLNVSASWVFQSGFKFHQQSMFAVPMPQLHWLTSISTVAFSARNDIGINKYSPLTLDICYTTRFYFHQNPESWWWFVLVSTFWGTVLCFRGGLFNGCIFTSSNLQELISRWIRIIFPKKWNKSKDVIFVLFFILLLISTTIELFPCCTRSNVNIKQRPSANYYRLNIHNPCLFRVSASNTKNRNTNIVSI